MVDGAKFNSYDSDSRFNNLDNGYWKKRSYIFKSVEVANRTEHAVITMITFLKKKIVG